MTDEAARLINETKAAGKRVIAVGTTSVRTLESAALESKVAGQVSPISGPTKLFILPGYPVQDSRCNDHQFSSAAILADHAGERFCRTGKGAGSLPDCHRARLPLLFIWRCHVNRMSVNQDSLQSISNEVIACRLCPRLVEWREQVGVEKRKAFRDHEYWAKPVPGFGDPNARVLLLGLAPGAHGSNRTGRMFTGDDSGRFLYAALHRAGFANQPESLAQNDGLMVIMTSGLQRFAAAFPQITNPLPVKSRIAIPTLPGR